MLLTDRFVYIHQPKTGGTFVTDVIKRVEGVKRKGLPKRVFSTKDDDFVDANKHGTCDQIPEEYRDKPIIATIRNPWSRFVSQYHFGWWKEYPPEDLDMNDVKSRFPDYPDLPFPEFLEYLHHYYQRLDGVGEPTDDLHGFQSRQFVRFYFKDALKVYPTIDDAFIEERRWEQHMYPVRFIRQGSLNQELHDALLELGYEGGRLAFILEEARIRPPTPPSGSKAKKHWSEYYTEDLRAVVRKRERLLFSIFPDFGLGDDPSPA